MPTKKAIWIGCGCLVTTATTVGVFALVLAQPTNCGGNTAALNNCKMILIHAELFSSTNSFLPDANQMSAEERDQFLDLGVNHWTSEARYWVRTNQVDSTDRRQIVVFCDQSFDNVPQPKLLNLYKRTSAYAAGFADGTAGLVSPEVFTQLRKSDFAPLANLKHRYQP